MRFRTVAIPPGASIVAAYVQFTSRDTSDLSTTFTISGEAVDNSLVFAEFDGNISSRLITTAQTVWHVPPWTQVDAAGETERTPDLSAIIQEIVDRPGWLENGAMALFFSGTGQRTAWSFQNDGATAPLLHIEWNP
jgi:hypothetical protein